MTYRCLNKQNYEQGLYTIVPLNESDMELIRVWRNAQMAILRQNKELTEEDQRIYWKEVILPSFEEPKPRQILFSFLNQGERVGYGGLTYLDWEAKRGEVSFLLEPSRTINGAEYRTEYMAFLTLLRQAVFEDMRFHRMFAETFDVRPDHVAALVQFGFKQEGVLRDHAVVEGRFVNSLIHGLLNDG